MIEPGAKYPFAPSSPGFELSCRIVGVDHLAGQFEMSAKPWRKG